MAISPPNSADNRLLGLLPRDEYRRLMPWLSPVNLKARQVLGEPGEPIRYAYFPRTCVLSWSIRLESGANVEVATIGREGMAGFRTVLGAEAMPARIAVQVPGQALRLPIADLHSAARRDSSLARIVQRYVGALLTQVTQAVACNGYHPIDKRLCRWLLMTHDRVQSDQFALTHELLAQTLGVRRATVSEAASRLQAAGLIRYVHGKISVQDRAGLEAASCECYHAVEREYDAMLS